MRLHVQSAATSLSMVLIMVPQTQHLSRAQGSKFMTWGSEGLGCSDGAQADSQAARIPSSKEFLCRQE